MTMATPIVHGPGYSTYVRTTRMTLEEKGIAYDLREFDFMQGMPEEHLKRHPFGKVPAFEHDGFMLYETAAITRYVDEGFEGPSLQSIEVHARTRMAQIICIIDSYTYGPVLGQIVIQRLVVPMMNGTPDEAAIEAALPAARKALGVLEGLIGDQPFVAGNTLSLADLHLAPILAYFSGTPEGEKVLADTPNLRRWFDNISARPTFASTAPQFG
jgi:glutathione S-transferase